MILLILWSQDAGSLKQQFCDAAALRKPTEKYFGISASICIDKGHCKGQIACEWRVS